MGLDMYLTDRQNNDLGYWRKANAIHGYIVRRHADGVDKCQKIELTRADLIALRSLCYEVLFNPHKARELLPPTEGFLFGSYEIDEGYRQDLVDTAEILNRALETKKRVFVYQASW